MERKDNLIPGSHDAITSIVVADAMAERQHEPASPDLSHGETLTWESQEAFLDGFVRLGTVLKASLAADISRTTSEWWTQNDKLGFAERYAQARRDRIDHAEAKYVLHRLDNPKGNYGTDLMAIAYMNRLDPEHWNRNLKLTHDVPNEVIQQLRALQELGSKVAQELPEPKVVDGKAEVLPWE